MGSMLIMPGNRNPSSEGKRQRILVEVELEAYLLCPTEVTGIVNVLAKNACNQEGHRRFAFVKRKEGHMVAWRKTGNGLQGAPRDHRAPEHEAQGAVGQLGAKAKIEFGSNSSRKPWSWTTGFRRRKLSCSRKGKKGRSS